MNQFRLPNTFEEKSILKTIRIKKVTLNKIESLSKENNISINRIVNECIEFALDNLAEDFLPKGK